MPPGAEAQQGGDPCHEQDRADAGEVRRAQGVQVGPRSFEDQGEQQQRQDGHGAQPDGEAQRVRWCGLAGQDVGDAPEGRGGHDAEEAGERPRGALVHGGRRDAGHGDGHARQAPRAGAFAEGGHGEQGGEDGLSLQHKRGQPGGHAHVHADEQQAELAHTQDQSHGDDPPPGHRRPADEEDGGHGGGQEAQGAEQQGREAVETGVYDDEVDAPQGGNAHGKEGVERAHTSHHQETRPCSTSTRSYMMDFSNAQQ
ncbi:hypothetical protein GCM10010315_19090 [Streptomyces luteosporeus]|uniref:Uncharacterized protein n=1 Tax=Streptomyces luteosporeus TaxID=173856 RepID=A0ABP6G719_9ACTN